MVASIQLPLTAITTALPMSFGTNVSVCSCSWVTDCRRPITTPTASTTARNGPATLAQTINARVPMSMTCWLVMWGLSP
jgi:hypothetical protein